MRRTLKFLPLTFIAGTWGFVIFMPYLLAFGTAVGVASMMRRTPAPGVAAQPA